MKQLVGAVVVFCGMVGVACADGGEKTQTIRIASGKSQDADIVVSNTITLGSSGGQGCGGCGYYPSRPALQYVQPTVPPRYNYYTGNGIETVNTQNVAPVRYTNEERRMPRYSPYNLGYGYVGAHLDLNLLSWRNTYTALPETAIYDMGADHDDYHFKPVIGGNIFLGYRFNTSWRADVEFGFTSKYTDSDNGITFELSVPYVTANLYHDFSNGLYLGIGAGAAFPTISMEWENFTANSSSKTGSTFTGAAMVGYSYELSESLFLDVRYRISGFRGPSITRGVSHFGELQSLETKVGFVLDNAISVGVRYEF